MWQNAGRISVLVVVSTAWLAAACAKSESHGQAEPVIAPAAPGVQQTKIKVDNKGFTPNEVKLEKGKPAELVFVRTSDETCAKQVVFPELKIEKDLPLNAPVRIEIPTQEARTLTFQCGMAMYKSAVLIQ